MNIAILGTGRVALTLGGGLAERGHQVILGSRRPADVDAPLPVATHAEAVAAADLVVNAVAGAHALDAIAAIGPDVLSGKTLLDLGNAVNASSELMFPNSSLGEQLQHALPRTRVVKALNTLAAPIMIEPSLVPASTVFVSGDDEQAKSTVKGVLGDLGWGDESVLDLGGIASSRGPEHYFLLFAAVWQATGSPIFNVKVARQAT